ncbi:hypothetical protein [Methylocella sp. CPCC 101449]|jgi:hypothetical protein|uniref:hypothetical protein n=1 Tax=Methylocella sp. CPCC 101449 TaxID=2987531 RepID=UPI00288EB9D4|nr:hypothetical protein [Methylocella sp. CPCC 101449]MDT2019858.1 hypothetical protein [Methylocella sp. CPCC 101449]HEV2575236.1 hypothetical protein [Beijerinckiaceae bacterium]
MISKKTLAATAGALALAATFAASTPASAGWKHHHGYGGGLAVGLLGAAIVGGAIAASQQPAYGYGGGCEIRQRPIYNAWGDVVGYRRPVRVCY